jgi:hypothetical protein
MNRPQDALLHCLKLTAPDMVLVDEERIELFSSMQPDLGGLNMYCWSDTSQSAQDSAIQVCDLLQPILK